MTDGRCSYSHDVSDDTLFPDLDDTWLCPREAISDDDYCLFHTPTTHPARRKEDVTQELLDRITSLTKTPETQGNSQNRFIGVTLPTLAVAYHVLTGETTHPIDLRDATIRGDLNAQQADLSFPILLDGATIRGELQLHSARLQNQFRARNATIAGGINADDATFHGPVIIENTQIRGPIRFREASCNAGLSLQDCSVGGKCILHGADIDGSLRFTDTDCRAPLNIERVLVTDDARFDRLHCHRSIRATSATIHGRTSFGDAQIQGAAQFSTATFNQRVEFTAARFADRADFRQVSGTTAIFDNASFDAPVRFDEADIETASYANARFDAEARFTGLTAHNEVNLQAITLTSPLQLDHADIETITIETATTIPEEPAFILSLQHSTINNGTLEVQSQSLYYDAAHATLGDLTLSCLDKDIALFEGIRIHNTTFDGFDFTTVEPALRTVQWQLHTTTDAFPTQPSDYTTREKTYLKAKNGAQHVGATRAAAEFFRRELLNRRYSHYERAKSLPVGSKDWGITWYQWLANRVFEITAGYGERPRATIQTTFGTIIVFAGLYWLLLPTPPYDIGVAGYILFSLASFVTLVLGRVSPPSDPLVQFLAQLEGLLGAFLIALFVFTLTRSVHR